MENKIGEVVWKDLTVPNAEELKAFYSKLLGWKSQPVDMDGYQDYCMTPEGSDIPVGGICHQRGPNKNIPSQWLMYVNVSDMDKSMQICREQGGEIVDGPRDMGEHRFCVIKDPAGAYLALITGSNLQI